MAQCGGAETDYEVEETLNKTPHANCNQLLTITSTEYRISVEENAATQPPLSPTHVLTEEIKQQEKYSQNDQIQVGFTGSNNKRKRKRLQQERSVGENDRERTGQTPNAYPNPKPRGFLLQYGCSLRNDP